MSLHRWLQNLRSALNPGQRHPPRRGSPQAGTHRPSLEGLEARLTPAFWGPGFYYPAEISHAVDWAPPPPLVADVTSDGILDQINADGSVVVRPGRGDGTFGDPISSGYLPFTGALAVADFNGDGRLDVFTAGPDWDGFASACVLLGHGDGTFSIVQSYYQLPFYFPTQIGTISMYGSRDVAIAGYSLDTWEPIVAVMFNDNDWPTLSPSLRISDATVIEGNSGTASAIFTVTLSPGSAESVTVAYATSNGSARAGSDYQSTTGLLTFAPGQTTKTITVPVMSDRLGEPNETFFVTLSNPTNATIHDGDGWGTLLDDEPRVSITDVSMAEGRRGRTTLFTFIVSLSAAYDQTVTVSFQTANGTARTSDNDYVARAGTITFAPGETTKTITIEVKGDSKREVNEIFYIDLFGLSGNALFTKNRGLGTILNDD